VQYAASCIAPASLGDRCLERDLPATSPEVTADGHLPPGSAQERAPSCGNLSQLPQELVIEITKSLNLADLAMVGTANSAVNCKVWQEPGVWQGLSLRTGCDSTLTCLAAPSTPRSGATSREAFRRQHHRLDMSVLEAWSAAVQDAGREQLADILKELAHAACGLLPRDGASFVDLLISAAEQAMQVHDPTHLASAVFADKLMYTVRRRDDVISWLQSERLECARTSAVQLQALMEDLVDKEPDIATLAATTTTTTIAGYPEAFLDVFADADAAFFNDGGFEHRCHHQCGCLNSGFNEEARSMAASSAFGVDEQHLQDLCARFESLCREAGFSSEDS